MAAIKTQLIISASDDTAKAFASAEERVRKLAATVRSASTAVGMTPSTVARATSAQAAVRSAGSAMGSVAGIASAAAGYAMAYGGAEAVKETVKVISARQHEIVRMAVSGMKPQEIADATLEATKLSAEMPSVGLTETMHMLRNARSIVGSYKEAAEIAEPLMKLRTLAQLARPGQDVSEDFDQLVKGLEIKGVTQNPAQFKEYMEGIAKGINVFGDTLKPYQYYEMFKYGRQATSGLSEKFILGTAPTLAQELGGSSYGKAVSAFNKAIVGGQMEHQQYKELVGLGLLGNDDVEYTKTGEVKRIKDGRQIHGADVAQADPNQWVKDYLLPALDKIGIKDQAAALKEISKLFSNSSTAQMVDLLATQQSRIDKDMALIGAAPGLSAAEMAMRADPSLAWQGLKAAIEALTSTLGQSLNLAGAMTDLAQGIGHFTAGLQEEIDAQKKGLPSPGDAANRRFINKLVFGEDSSDTDYAADVAGRRSANNDFRQNVIGWTSRFDQLNQSIADDDGVINGGSGSSATVQRAIADRDAARKELERIRAEATSGNQEWRDNVENWGREDYGHDLAQAKRMRAAGGDGPFTTGAAGVSESTYIANAVRAAEQSVFGAGGLTVKMDPSSKADVVVHVTVSPTGELLSAVATAQASSQGSIAAHVGRMDTDAAPRHRVGGPD